MELFNKMLNKKSEKILIKNFRMLKYEQNKACERFFELKKYVWGLFCAVYNRMLSLWAYA